MKNLEFKKKLGIVLLSGGIIAGSGVGVMKAGAVCFNKCELKSTPIETTLENEDVLAITTIDEELAAGNIDIVNDDLEFREHAKELTYDNYKNDRAWYEENLVWLKQNYVRISSRILFAAGKCAVADELEVNMNSVTLHPSLTADDPKGYVNVSKGLMENETFKVRSKHLNKLITLVDNLEYDVDDMKDGRDIAKKYDNVINTANTVIQTGLSRQDNKLEEKFTKKFMRQKKR